MAVRKDQVQIDITFLTDENRQFAKLNQSNQTLLRDLRKTKKEGGDLAAIIGKIAKEGEAISDIDLSRVAPAELVSRARNLRQVLQQIPDSAPGAAKLQEEYKRINTRLAEIRQNTRGVIQETSKLGSIAKTALGVFGGISLAGIGQGILNIGRNIIKTSSNFQKFEAVLTNTLGSKSEAQAALKQLQEFAATTPFQLEELTGSYVKLVNRGIKPTIDDLRLLGDLAASQGKDFDQLVEAVLDAGTAEFERLKEFGIRAKKDGDIVSLTFKGITKEVENSDAAITQAILDFGKFEGVLGSTESISRTRAGRISNLADSISRLFNNLGNGYLGRIIDLAIGGISSLVESLAGFTEQEKKASDSVESLQFAFNAQIETLKRGNLSQENRKKLIEQINARYGEYLPNLITEKTSLEDITKAQDAANKSFQQRILILSAQEQLQETNKALLKSTAEQLRLEEQLSIQQAKLTTARAEDAERARKLLPGAERQGAQAQVQAALNSIQARIDAEAAAQRRLQKEFERSIEAAQKFGVDIEAALSTGSGVVATNTGGGGALGEKGLDTRLKGIEAFFTRQQLLLDRSLLTNEVSESEHGKRMLELQVDQYNQQLEAYELYNKAQSNEAEEARNKLIEIQQQLTRNPGAVQGLGAPALPGGVERRGIDAGLDAAAQQEEEQLNNLRRQFENALIAESAYSVAKLELRRMTLEQEIELLRQGTDAEILEASRRADQLKEIDEQLAAERKRIAEDEAEVKRNINQAAIGFFQDSIDFGIQLLSQDEEARKKNIGVIKAFQKGKVVASGIAEVQKIWEKAAEFGPLQSVLAAFQTLAASVRTGTAIAKIDATSFSASKGIALGEFGGKLHSGGGTKGVFSDGTRIEVERGEKFVVLNRNASRLLGGLSDLNMATGGRSLLSSSARLRYNTGGVVPVNTTPANIPGVTPGLSGPDLSPMLDEFRLLREAFLMFPTRLRADVAYTDIESAASDVNSVRENSSV